MPPFQAGEALCSCRHGLFDIFSGVRAGYEARLVGGRRQVNTRVQHFMEELVECRGVAGHHLGVVLDLWFCREEAAEHRARVVGGEGHARLLRRGLHAFAQAARSVEEGLVKTFCRNNIQRGHARGDG